MSVYRRKFNEKVLVHRPRLRRFLTKLENNLPRGIDRLTLEADRETWAEVDCLACSNCCRVMTPTYTPQDLKRITAHLGMTIDDFKEKWLYKDRKGEWMNRSTPCQFLDRRTNMCSIYPIRPADCAGFPHLAKRPAAEYMHIHRQNVQYCPATFTFVEKLIEKVGKL
ncbi:MAG: YkgJ family cysteine cluster protein [Chitinophagaceae bacterium]|nr:MAG: YkgJ family cysteine cluster protein [Chitinophagaceae bacterium]